MIVNESKEEILVQAAAVAPPQKVQITESNRVDLYDSSRALNS